MSSTGQPPAAGTDGIDFDALVADILEDPEKILSADLSPETVLELQKRINPYAGLGGPPADVERKRIAAVSYTNLREDYLRRFTATSLVGFIFQVLKEWEVPAEVRRWVPAAVKGAAPNPAHEPFAPADLVKGLEAAADLARAAAAAAEEATEAQRAQAEASATGASVTEVAAALETATLAAAKAAALVYAATHAAHRVGAAAGLRLPATAQAGMRPPDVRAGLAKYPVPSPPGTLEMPPAAAKAVIDNFLRAWFEFDPNAHVRSGHNAAALAASVAALRVGDRDVAVDTADPGHLTVDALRAAPPRPTLAAHAEALKVIRATPAARAAVSLLLRDDTLAAAAAVAVAANADFQQYLLPVPATSAARTAATIVPPQDTYHRWAYYTEVNYEELRTVTEALYPERPDLDWALALWEVFDGPAAEVDAAFEKHCQRYQDEVTSSIKALEFGAWTLLADFKANRDKIQFYNKHTEVLKRIIDRHGEDKRIGAELMRNRVRQTKARNIAEAGADAAGLAGYKRVVAEGGGALSGKGAEKVISTEEMRRLEAARGDIKAAREIELLEQLETTIATLTDTEALRPLTADEARDLAHARATIDSVREMVAVPDDAIQVDVFSSDAAGGFSKTHFYTKAEGPEAPPADANANASGHPAAKRSAALQQAKPQGATTGVTAGAPTGATAGAPTGATAYALPPLAPFAVEHILQDAAERSDATIQAEALKAANAQ